MKDAGMSILLVEDDEVDVIKVRRAFEKNKLEYALHVAENGVDALELLRQKVNEGSLPRIILLDLNTPKMNGIEFLKQLRTDPQLRKLIVVVLTTSKDERDVFAAYEYNVAGYIVKPVSFQEFVDALSQIDHYWSLCELPQTN